jgi:hypothetical protein
MRGTALDNVILPSESGVKWKGVPGPKAAFWVSRG